MVRLYLNNSKFILLCFRFFFSQLWRDRQCRFELIELFLCFQKYWPGNIRSSFYFGWHKSPQVADSWLHWPVRAADDTRGTIQVCRSSEFWSARKPALSASVTDFFSSLALKVPALMVTSFASLFSSSLVSGRCCMEIQPSGEISGGQTTCSSPE
jgi:hypothetical protein